MRLDHLLSKENRVFLFCRLVGCLVRHLVVASFLFAGESKYPPTSCVGFGISETRMSVVVFWFVLLCGMLLGV